MITEDYISFETAMLLKKHGFNEKCDRVYDHDRTMIAAQNFMEGESSVDCDDIDSVAKYEGWITYTQGEYAYLCPTLQMTMKWLRKVHKLGIFPSTYTSVKGDDIKHVYGTSIVNLDTFEVLGNSDEDDYIFESDSYEETAEKAIRYCLENLI